jgi:two-component system OmpR family sensor kinase
MLQRYDRRKSGDRRLSAQLPRICRPPDPDPGVESTVSADERRRRERRRQVAEEQARLLAREQAARAEAEAAIRARDQFLSVAAHELRTPVASIKGFAQLLLRLQEHGHADPERLDRFLRSINEAANRLSELTDDLLEVSRVRMGQLDLRPRPLDLVSFLRELVAEYQDRLDSGHRLTLDLPAEPCVLPVDPARLRQVLDNLLDNAVKYSPDGSAISLTLHTDADGAVIAVQDHGIGLPPGAAETIFEPFGRAANAAARQIPGMGLGLYVCRNIVEQHGGRIWAESEGDERGTRMSVHLPWRHETPPAAPDQ